VLEQGPDRQRTPGWCSGGVSSICGASESRCIHDGPATRNQQGPQRERHRSSPEVSFGWGIEHRYLEYNGVQIMATLHSLDMNPLRLEGFWSITEGLAALTHDIRGLLSLLGWQEPLQALNSA
jgi:hypothetical protein